MNVLVVGLDTFARKNRAQLELLGARGCRFDVLTNDLRGDSAAHFYGFDDAGHTLTVLKGGPLRRLAGALRALVRAKPDVVELYATGRMAFVYVLLLKARRIPFIVIERGDIGFIEQYDAMTRYSMRLAYRNAALVIYRETFMPERLKQYGATRLAFIPNAVAVPDTRTTAARGRFLWVNRIIPQRRPEWLVHAFADPIFAGARLTVMGLEDRNRLSSAVRALQDDLRTAAADNTELLPFGEPGHLYRDCRYFCFPAEMVFGNNALLEAMAHGLVPVVNEAPGVELVVRDGENGIVTAFDEASYRRGLERALALSDDDWRRLSDAAVSTVREQFGLERWAQRTLDAYGSAR